MNIIKIIYIINLIAFLLIPIVSILDDLLIIGSWTALNVKCIVVNFFVFEVFGLLFYIGYKIIWGGL
jgi:hypothetical protein